MKIRTLARTLHEQAVRNSTLRNSGSSDGIENIKIYYSGCIVQNKFKFRPLPSTKYRHTICKRIDVKNIDITTLRSNVSVLINPLI
jgi:hypothetical protein